MIANIGFSIATVGYLLLLLLLFTIRSVLLHNKSLYLPIFVAHSEHDWVTPITGVEELMANVKGEHTFFRLAKSLEVCHDALPLNDAQIALIPQTNKISADSCSFKNANPVHANMLATFEFFLADQIGSLKNDNNK